MSRTALIGTGVMGETLLAGLLHAGWAPTGIVGADRRESRRHELEGRYGVKTEEFAADAVAGADTVILVVKPQDVADLLPEIAANLAPGAVVVSLCAGVTTGQLEDGLPADTPVVRVMPNTPAQVSEGMAAVSAGAHASAVDLEKAVDIMEAVGKAIVVPERYQDAVTALSGSGPAYLFFVVEAMIDAGVGLGLPRDISTALVNQTMYGSAKLLVESERHPTLLREMVTSPAGTTAAALRHLEERSVKAAFMAAIEAARDRSEELGRRD
ncbi:pyrroline-5-carboxylate reductase [Propioniciclava coleopterorum]|uniref:Pyrroline-5-carboxylate reductase n=1 Tax=Propioniciclava coleopterorum TaxID=2714937 RepID=A0A6G7Y542_9ACTN|nr:pyrroline-5-carboxylate reductase [Propioniciclava coleopterorum]QIK71758.1 pyrroline-5-carboxylate reductase [Propioniciclava coleopterorum]